MAIQLVTAPPTQDLVTALVTDLATDLATEIPLVTETHVSRLDFTGAGSQLINYRLIESLLVAVTTPDINIDPTINLRKKAFNASLKV